MPMLFISDCHYQIIEGLCGSREGFLQKDDQWESLGFDDSNMDSLDGKYVALYFTQGDMKDLKFTGYETRPCATFTGKLKQVYAECKRAGKAFEVITLISNTSQLDIWKREHPWSSILCHGPTKKRVLEGKYQIYSSPALIVFAPDGSLCSRNARGAVMDLGADGFPWQGQEDPIQAPPGKPSNYKILWQVTKILAWLVFIVGTSTTYFHYLFSTPDQVQDAAAGAQISPSQTHEPISVSDHSEL